MFTQWDLRRGPCTRDRTNYKEANMKQVIEILDPQTYGMNRTPIVLGIVVAVVAVTICSKLLGILHAAQVQ